MEAIALRWRSSLLGRRPLLLDLLVARTLLCFSFSDIEVIESVVRQPLSASRIHQHGPTERNPRLDKFSGHGITEPHGHFDDRWGWNINRPWGHLRHLLSIRVLSHARFCRQECGVSGVPDVCSFTAEDASDVASEKKTVLRRMRPCLKPSHKERTIPISISWISLRNLEIYSLNRNLPMAHRT